MSTQSYKYADLDSKPGFSNSNIHTFYQTRQCEKKERARENFRLDLGGQVRSGKPKGRTEVVLVRGNI